jgi:hypothetical protein
VPKRGPRPAFPRAGSREPSCTGSGRLLEGSARATHRRAMGSLPGAARPLRSGGFWHDQPIGHSGSEVPQHRGFASRYRDLQRFAFGRLELDKIGAIGLWAIDGDFVLGPFLTRTGRVRWGATRALPKSIPMPWIRPDGDECGRHRSCFVSGRLPSNFWQEPTFGGSRSIFPSQTRASRCAGGPSRAHCRIAQSRRSECVRLIQTSDR